MRSKVGMVGVAMLALLALLACVPSALASTASLRGGTTVVYQGDAVADTVTLSRQVVNNVQYYVVRDSGGISSGTGCFQVQNTNNTTSACSTSAGLKRYEITTGGGDDRVDVTAATTDGVTDLGPGTDRFTGLGSGSSADTVKGGDGSDTIDGGAGNDPLDGGAGDDSLDGGAGNDPIDGGAGDDSLTGGAGGDQLLGGAGIDTLSGGSDNDSLDGGADADSVAGGSGDDLVGGGDGADRVVGDDGNDVVVGGPGDDQVTGQAGDDLVDGGPGADSLEFAGTGMPAGVGAGADDLRGGDGVDLLSYNDHTAGITLTLDEQPGDGSAGEGDNVRGDIETVIATTFSDRLTGNDAGQDLYGHGGDDIIDGRGGDDLLNGGTGEDTITGGPGDDAVEGSAGGDLLDGGAGRDLIAGDNECTTLPCTGGSDQILARDGEEDTVNCGVGADRATVDAIDIVALDSQQGCESIDRAAPAAAPAAAGGTVAALAPIMRVRGGRSVGNLLRRGLRVDVICPAACRIRARLIFRKTVVAGARRTRIVGAATRLRVKSNRAGKRRLRGRRKVLVTLVIDVTDSAGRKTTLARAIMLKKPTRKAKKPA